MEAVVGVMSEQTELDLTGGGGIIAHECIGCGKKLTTFISEEDADEDTPESIGYCSLACLESAMMAGGMKVTGGRSVSSKNK